MRYVHTKTIITLESEYERQLFTDILEAARINQEKHMREHGYRGSPEKTARWKQDWRNLLMDLLEV